MQFCLLAGRAKNKNKSVQFIVGNLYLNKPVKKKTSKQKVLERGIPFFFFFSLGLRKDEVRFRCHKIKYYIINK